MMFNKGKHDKKALGTSGSSRAFKTVGYALAGTALLGFSTVQSGLVNPQAIAETSAGGDTPTTDDANVNSTLAYSTASKASEKDETVYVFAKPDGSVKNTKVSAELRNPKKAKTLKDQTELKNLQNTENDGEHATTSEGTVWETKGKDVYYMGDTDKEAPVRMKVSYKLDGKDIEAKDLLGKSGHVTIRFDFTNDSYEEKTVDGKKTRIFTPFMALTGMLFDNDQFKNVKAKNAKVVDDGDRTVVAGYALPGLQESLDIDEDTYKVPDYIQVSADTTDFEMGQTLTMVTNDLFNDVDTDKLDSDKLDNAIDQLQDGMNRLIDGSNELVKGLNNLSNGAHTLSTGAGTLANGTKTLAGSVPALATGVKKLDNGAGQLAGGIKQAGSQGKALPKGANQMLGGLQQMKNGTKTTSGLSDALSTIGSVSDTGSTTLLGGTNQLAAGLQQVGSGIGKASDTGSSTLLGGTNQLAAGLQQVGSGIGKASDTGSSTLLGGANQLSGGLGQLSAGIGSKTDTGSDSLYGGTNQLSAGLSQLESKSAEGLTTASAGASKLESGLKELKTGLGSAQSVAESLSTGLGSVDTSSLTAMVTKAEESASSLKETATTLEKVAESLPESDSEQKQYLNKIAAGLRASAESATPSDATKQQLAKLSKDLDDAQQGAKGIAGGLAKANANLGDEKSSSTLIGGAHALATGLDSSKSELSSGVGQLKTGVTKLQGGLDSASGGISQLSTGAGALKNGLVTASSGVSQLSTGAGALKNGLVTAGNGVTQLSAGTGTLKSGLNMLANGTNGKKINGKTSTGLKGAVNALGNMKAKGTLINGASQISSGSSKLVTALNGQILPGAQQLSSGTSQLNSKVPALASGVNKLNDGAQKLSSGSKTLAKGALSAAAGGKTLSDGLKTYNRKGIKKIVDAYNDNLKGLSTRLTAVRDAGKDYNNFTGISKGTKGKVKFIFETDAVEHDDDE